MVQVIKKGLETSVQDYPGRIGTLNQGFPASGPMDSWSFRLANILVGNKPGDRVKFIPTSYEEFDHVSNKVKDKSYDYNIIDYQKFSVKNYKNWLKTIDKSKRF